jgi:hypothetical protein
MVDLIQRRDNYRAIEEYRRRPLIVYATSTRPNVQAAMAGDAVREFIDQIDAVPKDGRKVDVLLHSTGGDALTAWKLMSILRERFDEVAVLVPFMAFSAATLFALGADEIHMHPHASLGPIDPQILIQQPGGPPRQFAYEDVGAFLRFLASDVKVTEQLHVSAIIEKLFSVVDPVHVGAAKRASELSSSVGERLLLMHMSEGQDRAKARQIAENLNKSFFAHGDAVSRKRAKELELNIGADDAELAGVALERLSRAGDLHGVSQTIPPPAALSCGPGWSGGTTTQRAGSAPAEHPPSGGSRRMEWCRKSGAAEFGGTERR